MSKRRHHLTPEEESALMRDIQTRMALSTKELMRKYDASRSLIDKRTRQAKERKQNASKSVHAISAGATCA